MATIVKKDNGKYLIRVSAGYDSCGKRNIYSKIYSPTATTDAKIKKELERAAVEFEDQVINGKSFSADKLSFQQYYENQWKGWAVRKLSVRAMEDYCAKIEKYALTQFGKKKLSEIKAVDIRKLIEKMDKEGMAVGTQRKTVTAINSVFSLAWADDILETNPVAKGKKAIKNEESDGEVHSFSIEETKKFLAFLEEPFISIHKAHTREGMANISEYTENHSVGTMWKAYFNLAIFGGFRRGEMLGLTWVDVDFENHRIDINKAVSATHTQGVLTKAPKTKTSVRNIELPQACFDILREWKQEQMEKSLMLGSYWKGYRGKDFDSNSVFVQADGQQMAVDSPYQALKRLIERYNGGHEDKLPDIRLHDLRHTSASILIASDNDIATVSRRLGHSNPATTLRYYTHADADADRKASESLEKVIG